MRRAQIYPRVLKTEINLILSLKVQFCFGNFFSSFLSRLFFLFSLSFVNINQSMSIWFLPSLVCLLFFTSSFCCCFLLLFLCVFRVCFFSSVSLGYLFESATALWIFNKNQSPVYLFILVSYSPEVWCLFLFFFHFYYYFFVDIYLFVRLFSFVSFAPCPTLMIMRPSRTPHTPLPPQIGLLPLFPPTLGPTRKLSGWASSSPGLMRPL